MRFARRPRLNFFAKTALLTLLAALLISAPPASDSQERTERPKLYIETGEGEFPNGRAIADHFNSVAFTPDGRRFVSASSGMVKVWDAESGKLVSTLRGHTSPAYSLALKPDGRQAATGGTDNTARVWDIESGKLLKTLVQKAWMNTVAFTPDGRRIITGNGDPAVINKLEGGPGEIGIWDLESGRLKRLKRYKHPVRKVVPTMDDKCIVILYYQPTIEILDIGTGKLLHTLRGHTKDVDSVTVTPDGTRIVSGGYDGTIKVWDARSGGLLRTINHPHEFVSSVAATPDGGRIIAGSSEGPITVWDMKSGELLQTLLGHFNPSIVATLAVSPDGQRLLSGGTDYTARMWDLSTGREIVQAVSFDDEWVSLTPEGYYVASPQGDKHLKVSIDGNDYGIEQFRSTFYKPEVVQAALRLRNSSAAVAGRVGDGAPTIETVASFLPPVISVSSPADGQQISGLRVELSFQVEDRIHPLKSVQIFVNQSRAASTRTRGWGSGYEESAIALAEGQRTLDLRKTLQLQPGENVIKVVAANAYAETPRTIRVVTSSTSRPTANEVRVGSLPQLWILAIGVNDTPQLSGRLPKLSFAAADSEAFVRKFKEQEGRLFSKVNALVINDSPSKEIESLAKDRDATEIRKISSPTFENIADNLRYLRNSRPGDYVMLFIAGHAVSDDGAYYFIPSDAALNDDGSVKRSRAISWTDIKDAIYLLNVRVWVFLDTCHAADVVGRVKTADTNYLIKELQDSALVFASSTGAQTSQEGVAWGHGAFTYALLKGLGGQADHLRDGTIMMSELESYVTNLVTKETGERQTPVIYPKAFQDVPIFKLSK